MIVHAQGRKFEFAISQLRRGCWISRLEKVNDILTNDYGSDPYPSERECRKGARLLAVKGFYDPVYGWCLPVARR